MLLHQGARELQWELFLGPNRIDWKLIETGGFTVETKQDLVSVEIPLFSPGMTYEVIALKQNISTYKSLVYGLLCL